MQHHATRHAGADSNVEVHVRHAISLDAAAREALANGRALPLGKLRYATPITIGLTLACPIAAIALILTSTCAILVLATLLLTGARALLILAALLLTSALAVLVQTTLLLAGARAILVLAALLLTSALAGLFLAPLLPARTVTGP